MRKDFLLIRLERLGVTVNDDTSSFGLANVISFSKKKSVFLPQEMCCVMRVIFHYLLVVFFSALLLVGCGKKASKKQNFDPTIPVKVQVVGDSNGVNYRNYVGTVRSERQVSLSFPLGGTLTEVHVRNDL